MKTKTQRLGHLGYQTAAFLTILGVYFSLSRYFLPHELHRQISLFFYYEEYTNEALPALASFSWTELTHRLLGAIFLVLGLLQFKASFRKKRMALHRNLGKLFFLFCLTAAVSGMIFAWMIPFAGLYESIVVTIVAAFLLYCTYQAWATIRKGDVQRHQVYTRYAYGVGVGVITIRLIIYALFVTTNMTDRLVFNVGLTAGWVVTLSAIFYYNQLERAERKAMAIPG